MNLKQHSIKALGAFSLFAVIATAFAFTSNPEPQEKPQVIITSDSYKVVDKFCEEYCTAKVKAGEYDIFVDYRLDNGSVEFLDILNVVHFDESVNAHIDRYEIEKINAAIVGV